MKSNPRKMIGSVQRALEILDLFDRRSPELGTTEISRALVLPKSTVAGLVLTLEANGYLNQNPQTRKYRLGYKLAERTGVMLEQFDLRHVAAPVLAALREEVNESINLAVRDGEDVIYIERLHSTNTLGMHSEIGKREKIYSTALGKAILAALPDTEAQDLVQHISFEPRTPHTMLNAEALLQDLHSTRQRGFATDDEENEIGGRCVAAPIFDYAGRVVGAVSISVPVQRIPDEKISQFGERVRLTAGEISRRLGARPGELPFTPQEAG